MNYQRPTGPTKPDRLCVSLGVQHEAGWHPGSVNLSRWDDPTRLPVNGLGGVDFGRVGRLGVKSVGRDIQIGQIHADRSRDGQAGSKDKSADRSRVQEVA